MKTMLFDVVFEESSIVIVSDELLPPGRLDRQLTILVKAVNNSYLPLGDRYVALYEADRSRLNDRAAWKQIFTQMGSGESELEYAYPMQRVWTKEGFTLRISKDTDFYLIAQIKEKGNEYAAIASRERCEKPEGTLTSMLYMEKYQCKEKMA